MSIIGVPMLLGPIIGPILGGWLVDDVSWRWIFFINIPIGVAALGMSLRVLPRDEPQRHERFDALGLALLSPGLALFIYGLAKSSGSGGFGSSAVIVPCLAGELGAAMLTALLDRAWLVRRPAGRAVAVTPRGAAGLHDVLAIDVAALAPAAIDRTPLRRVA